VPVRNGLVRDARRDVEHDDGALALDAAGGKEGGGGDMRRGKEWRTSPECACPRRDKTSSLASQLSRRAVPARSAAARRRHRPQASPLQSPHFTGPKPSTHPSPVSFRGAAY
jgi:hypothetical protein